MKNILNGFVCIVIIINITIHTNLKAQTISTIAGDSTCSFGGDNIAATATSIFTAVGGQFDRYGNFYFATGDHRIRKISTSGIITTIAGTGTAGFWGDEGLATNAQLHQPGYIAVDKIGNIFIPDIANNRIRKVDTFGIIHTIAGNGLFGFAGDTLLATSASLWGPNSVCVDDSGNVYEVETVRIRKINSSGIINTVVGNGVSGFSGDNGLATAAASNPNMAFIDASNNLYISENGNHRVRKVDAVTQIITTIAGNGGLGYSAEGLAATASTITPSYITLDALGNLYIADGVGKIRKVDTFGIINTVVGNGILGYWGDGGLADTCRLHNPDGLVFDICGNLYISDCNNCRVRKVSYPLVSLPPTFAISSVLSDTICSGTSKTFNSTITGGYGGSATYQWYINGTLTAATSSSYTYTPANGDSIRCVLTYSSPCSGTTVASSNTIHIVVDSYSVPSISVTAPVYATIGSIVTVNATIAGAGSSYNIHWYNRGVLFATTTVPTTTYTKVWGIDTITARVVSTAAGCYDSTLSTAHLVTDSTTEVGNYALTNHSLTIYPNPAGRGINVGYVGIINNIVVSNLLGSVLIWQAGSKNTEEVNIASLPSGVYFVKVNGVEMGRFVKE